MIATLGGHLVPYDYLVLCCGEQFQIAIPSGADVNTLVTTAEVPRSRDQVYKGSVPANVFTVNSHQDVLDILHWIETSFSYSEGTRRVTLSWRCDDFLFVISSRLRSDGVLLYVVFAGKAVIYGTAFASYTFVQGVLALGIPGSRLVMIQPPTNLPSCFNNPEVDELVEQSLEIAGTKFLWFWLDPTLFSTFSSCGKERISYVDSVIHVYR